MKKKGIMVLLILSLMLSVFLMACTHKDDKLQKTSETNVEDKKDKINEDNRVEGMQFKGPKGQITIGSTMQLTGDWIKYGTNNASDYEIYKFITGMSTISTTSDGRYQINETVIEKTEIKENEDKSKTYTFTVKDGLKYADGSNINAKDYITSVMLWSLKTVQDAGVKPGVGYYLKGYTDFSDGKVREFVGVNLISEKEFAITIASENLPYFYELSALESWPTKLSFWTDDSIEIKDDGYGVYFSDNFNLEDFEERFNIARKEIEEFPSTGAYKLKSYDKSARTAVLEVNDNFPGDYTGQKPKIKTVIYKKVTPETAINELKTGGVDVLSQITSGDEINAGLDLIEKGGFNFTKYPRAGYGKLMFQADFGPTKDVEVRQAIAHLLDRNDFAKSFTGGFGRVVNGPYGESMWFYQETKSELNEKLNQYTYSLEEAKNLLIKAGWTLGENGDEYKEGIRYKKQEDGKLMPLSIELASPEQNLVSDLLGVKLQGNSDIKEAGMEIKQTLMSLDELLLYMYRDGVTNKKYESPKFGMYNLAVNFTPKYDLSTNYTTDPDMIKVGYNTNFLFDKELQNAAKDMVKLDPEDKEKYKENFVRFVIKWNELLPDIPLYSNIYHDFFNDKLKGYKTNSFTTISDALLYSYLEER